MPLYSLKVQTFVARWKLFLSSSSAIFVDDAVPQCLLYCVCGHKKRFDQLLGFCGQKGQLQLKFIVKFKAVYVPDVMTVQHVRKWCREFSDGRVSVTDEQRSGRPFTSADLVTVIEETVHANRRVLLKELEEQFGLSHCTIWDIVHERLGYRKVCSRWVP